jgi:ribonuclease HI
MTPKADALAAELAHRDREVRRLQGALAVERNRRADAAARLAAHKAQENPSCSTPGCRP